MKFALIGNNIKHSLSPQIHRLLFQKHGVDATYRLLEIKNTDGILDLLLKGEYAGLNVTIPFKADFLHVHLSEDAQKMKSANVLKVQGDNVFGYNTDAFGFLTALRLANIPLHTIRQASILGTGGAARAAAYTLQKMGVKVTFYSRTKANGTDVFPYESLKYDTAALLVNATPLGMPPNQSVLPASEKSLVQHPYIMDMSYSLQNTVLQDFCKKHSIVCASGLHMLIAQAIQSQMIWLDCDYPVEEDLAYVYQQLGV